MKLTSTFSAIVFLVLNPSLYRCSAMHNDTHLAGGYNVVTDVDTDEEVQAAANYTCKEVLASDSNYTLEGVKSKDIAGYDVVTASVQVVAGLNIQMEIEFLDDEGECVGAADVIVYDQFGNMSITSFEDIGCPEPIELAGGYSSVPNFETDDQVKDASNFTWEALLAANATDDSNLAVTGDGIVGYEVTGASTQVVETGIHVRLDMIFVDSSGECVGAGTVVVHDNLGDMRVESWHETGCGETHDGGLAESAAYCNPTSPLFSLIKMMPLMLLLK